MISEAALVVIVKNYDELVNNKFTEKSLGGLKIKAACAPGTLDETGINLSAEHLRPSETIIAAVRLRDGKIIFTDAATALGDDPVSEICRGCLIHSAHEGLLPKKWVSSSVIRILKAS